MKSKQKSDLKMLVIGLVAFSALFVGLFNYKIIKRSGYFKNVASKELQVKAKKIVTAQTKETYELIRKALDDNNGTLTSKEKESLLNKLSEYTVGKTGYIWVLDYEGYYVLSKDRQRDGENMWDSKDSDGNMITQTNIEKGKRVSGVEIAYNSYKWLNPGESSPREKIAAIIHFPELEWVVGISTYYDDFNK